MRQADNDLSIPDQRRQAKGYCAKEVRIMGSKSVLLRTLVAASSAKPAMFGVYPSGAPEEIRTPDPQIRSLVLYPAELPVHLAKSAAEPMQHGLERQANPFLKE